MRYVRSVNTNAARLARLLAFFERSHLEYDLLTPQLVKDVPSHQPEWLRTIISKKRAFDELIATLVQYAILTPSSSTGVFIMHSTMQHLLSTECSALQREEAIRMAASLVCAAIPLNSTPDCQGSRLSLLPHAEQSVASLRSLRSSTIMAVKDSSLPAYYARLSQLFEGVSRFNAAQQMAEMCLQARQKIYGNDHIDTLHAMYHLAKLLQLRENTKADVEGKKQALSLYNTCAAGYSRLCGEEHTFVTDTYNDLGILHQELGSWRDAKTCYIRALGLKSDTEVLTLITNTPGQALDIDVVINLASVEKELEQNEHAETLYQWALTRLASHSDRKSEVATYDVLNNLGLLYEDIGREEEAEKFLLQSIDGKQNAWGKTHASTLRSHLSLGIVYTGQRRYQEAEKLFLHIMDLKGEETNDDAVTHSLGNLYCEMGRLMDAEIMYMRSFRTKFTKFGEHHPKTAATAINLALLYKKQGRYDESEEWVDKVHEAYVHIYGRDSVQCADTMSLRAGIRKAQGDVQEALVWYKRSLEAHKEAVGEQHVKTLHVEYNLAIICEENGYIEDGYKYARRALEGYLRTMPATSSQVLDVKWTTASLHSQAQEHKKAEELMAQVFEGFRELRGANDAATTSTGAKLAEYRERSKAAELCAPSLYPKGARLKRDE
jgi:tetratricopeptide (TPR) repeat protein